jgi:hypothetical protein
LTAVACLLAATATEAPPAWTSAALADQHGRAISAGDLRGRPAVVLLVTARRARLLKAWEQALAGLDDVGLLRVVDVPPGGKAAEVARMLRRRAPARVRVAVDAERVLARALALDPVEPHAVVLDAGGRVVATVRGRGKPAEAEAVRRALARVREKDS